MVIVMKHNNGLFGSVFWFLGFGFWFGLWFVVGLWLLWLCWVASLCWVCVGLVSGLW